MKIKEILSIKRQADFAGMVQRLNHEVGLDLAAEAAYTELAYEDLAQLLMFIEGLNDQISDLYEVLS